MPRVKIAYAGISTALAIALVATMEFGIDTSALAASKTPYQDCIDAHSMEFAWAECGSDEIRRQEKRLADIWKRSLKCFDENVAEEKNIKRDFIEDQRRWENWRNNACAVYEHDNYGAMSRVNGKGCELTIIEARIKFLQEVANPNAEICAPKPH